MFVQKKIFAQIPDIHHGVSHDGNHGWEMMNYPETGFQEQSRSIDNGYPLVNIQKTMENHHV